MDADRKLLAWEFASMTIENSKCSDSMIVNNRVDLLDKYNFLALPGTRKIRKSKQNGNNLMDKSRIYTYQTIRNIALSSKPNGMDIKYLEIIEQGCRKRDQTTDNLIAKVDAAKIALRLDTMDE
ncbi:hypothetical protein KUTeg_013508 [Tegillarca granosa]|uniref:Uncharacterized protein n=1 Tax=Tegillarca granosa TaxID=220873 RepID=A0ABQ9ETW7_TEGGR|nr:hypothetical protein KUTeg_013508 [Tegillarca granosa]